MEKFREELKEELCRQVDALTEEELEKVAGAFSEEEIKGVDEAPCPICGVKFPVSSLLLHIKAAHKTPMGIEPITPV